jgi:tetratricopeptide (TPR) repeat protein
LAKTYGNIGILYQSTGEYSKALSYHEKALKIRQQSLPPNHPQLQIYGKSLEDIKKKL